MCKQLFARWRPEVPAALLAAAALLATAAAQTPCTTQWLVGGGPSGGWPGVIRAAAERNNGDLILGGSFPGGVLRWDGTAWSVIGTMLPMFPLPPYPQVNAVCCLANGDVVVGGQFSGAGAPGTLAIARWNGTTWSTVGGGLGGPNPLVNGLTARSGGGLLACGFFSTAGAVSANGIAAWNGTTWSGFGTGITGEVRVAIELPNGDVVAAGTFSAAGGVSANNIARWNGSAWVPLGAGVAGDVWALALLHNGDLVAGGRFDSAGGAPASRIARWDGAAWQPLGAGVGTATPSNPYYDVYALLTLPDGDLLVGGLFDLAGGIAANHVARWNGSSWSAVGTGLGGAGPPTFLLMRGSGTVVTVVTSPGLSTLQSTCPATAVAFGSGCTGSGGNNVLTATSLPWTGATLRSIATGMPVPGLGVVAYGLATASVPLPSLLPQGLPGCTLAVAPLVLEASVVAGGKVTSALAIPDNAALAGYVLLAQVVALATDPTGNITEATATNALQFTVGVF